MSNSFVDTDTARADTPGPLHLVVVTPEHTYTRPCPTTGELIVGRASASDLHVDHDALSRRHARLRFDGDQVWIEDLGSSNGTKLAGTQLAPNVASRFERGQVVEIGPVSLILHRAVFVPRAQREGAPIESPATNAVYRTIERIAATNLGILILGETGVGKDVLAARAHALSPRAKHPMVRINCAAMSETLLESELFGYEKGAFSGAAQAKPGLLESADGGTFFLDEIGEMSIALQAKLLRVLEDRQVLRVGSIRPRAIDVRFIAATNRDLEAAVAGGRFRADLLHRLNTITVVLPPLRERTAEIGPLARRFAERAAAEFGAERPEITDDALRILERHAWPGNIRELRNTMDRVVALGCGARITAEHLRDLDRSGTPPSESLRDEVETFERQRIVDALEACDGNQTRAAARLGISRTTLIEKMRAYRLPRPRAR